jgi:RNA polymerase sigma-70 factor (ECF subfamily)
MINSFAQSISGDRFAAALDACRQFLLTAAAAEMPSYLTAKCGASDLVQETLTVAHQYRERFHGNTLTELRAWLRGILANELGTFRRRYRAACRHHIREVSVDAANHAVLALAQPIDHLIRAEGIEGLTAAVARLPSDAREVLSLRLDHRLGFQEIGARIGRTEEAVRKLFTRTLERLRQLAPNPTA